MTGHELLKALNNLTPKQLEVIVIVPDSELEVTEVTYCFNDETEEFEVWLEGVPAGSKGADF